MELLKKQDTSDETTLPPSSTSTERRATCSLSSEMRSADRPIVRKQQQQQNQQKRKRWRTRTWPRNKKSAAPAKSNPAAAAAKSNQIATVVHGYGEDKPRMTGRKYQSHLIPIPTDEKVDPPKSACFECWGHGHQRSNCPKPRKYYSERCFNCGRRNVTVRNCPRCKDAHRLHQLQRTLQVECMSEHTTAEKQSENKQSENKQRENKQSDVNRHPEDHQDKTADQEAAEVAVEEVEEEVEREWKEDEQDDPGAFYAYEELPPTREEIRISNVAHWLSTISISHNGRDINNNQEIPDQIPTSTNAADNTSGGELMICEFAEGVDDSLEFESSVYGDAEFELDQLLLTYYLDGVDD